MMSRVRVRFWDGHRQYEGLVYQLAEDYLLARIRIFDEADATILPREKVVVAVVKHLMNRVVPVEIGRGKTRADLLAKLERIERDPENPRRVMVRAVFSKPNETERARLSRILEETRVID